MAIKLGDCEVFSVGEVRKYQIVNKRPGDRIRFDMCVPVLIDFQRPKPKPVTNKVDFYQRFYAGEFGNHGPMWKSLSDWRKSRYANPIAIRTVKIGGRCDYNIPRSEVESRTAEFIRQGWKELNWSAMAPTDRTIVQGEACLLPGGLSLYVSREKLPMRDALRVGGRQLNGVLAHALLRGACDPDSYDQLNHLLDSYDGHVVEFSTFECCWGVIDNRNTVIWEVRKY